MTDSTPQPIHATIDRFERDAQGRRLAVLVLEDEQQLVVPAAALPRGSQRGDVVTISLALVPGEGQARRERIARLQRQLFGK